MPKIIEVCLGPNCANYRDQLDTELIAKLGIGIGQENSSFKIIKTICSKNCQNRFGPPVIRIEGQVFQGQTALENLAEIIFSPERFQTLGNKIYFSGDFTKLNGSDLGLAIDIGTTNVKIAFVNLASSESIAIASSLNGQTAYGPTVIDRVYYFLKQKHIKKEDGIATIQRAVLKTIDEMMGASPIDRNNIRKICVAGNTVMTYLFLGRDPDLYGKGEKSHYREPKTVMANELGIPAPTDCEVSVFPCVSEYVGGDIVSGIFGQNIFPSDKDRLFIDLGTNGEVALILKDPPLLLGASASAGPAFEGGGFRHGGYTMPGSITTVELRTGRFIYKTQWDAKPVNLCGSGVIEALCELSKNKIIDKKGNIGTAKTIVIAPRDDTAIGEDITINQNEIKYFIDSKAAIAATIFTLLGLAERQIENIEEIGIAGGFGSLDFRKAISLGLLPNLPLDRFKYLGNTSLAGAVKYLINQDDTALEKIVSNMTVFDFSSEEDLQTKFFDNYIRERIIP